MPKNATTFVDRHVRVKTPAQLAKKAENERRARERLERLQYEQRLDQSMLADRLARRALARQRAQELLAAARALPQFAVFLRITGRTATPGSAALFFSEHPDLRPDAQVGALIELLKEASAAGDVPAS